MMFQGTNSTPAAAGQAPVAQLPAPSASDVYEAMRSQRSELRNQLHGLESQRQGLKNELQSVPAPVGVEKTGLEKRMASVDERISDVEKQIANADAAVAKAAAVPGAVEISQSRNSGPDENEVAAIGLSLFALLMFPIVFAYARRIWRRASVAPAAIPAELNDRMNGIERAVESIAVEIERIGEGQRFVTKLYAGQAERKALQEESLGQERPTR